MMRALVWLLLSCVALAQAPASPPPASTDAPKITREQQKQAERAFRRAVRLRQQNDIVGAIDAAAESARLDPAAATYATTEKYLRAESAAQHIEAGNRLLEQHHRVEAAAEFRTALELDPTNDFAAQQYRQASNEAAQDVPVAFTPGKVEFAQEARLSPNNAIHDFAFRGDARQLFNDIADSYGLKAEFDSSFNSRSVRFTVDRVGFERAMEAAGIVTKTFSVPISDSTFLVAADTPDTRKRLEHLSMRTFYIPGATQQDLTDVLNLLRSVLDIRTINMQPEHHSLSVRAPATILDAAARLISGLDQGRPEVLLDIKAFEIGYSYNRQLGMSLPLQLNIFNVNTELRKLLSNPADQDLINRIIQSGQIDPSDVAAVAALLAGLQSQQGSPLLQPFGTVGGGESRFGFGVPPGTLQFNVNESRMTNLEHVTLRAQQGQAATFRVGSRFPVITASYGLPGADQLPQQIQQRISAAQGQQALIPAFNYEDLGIDLKTTPRVSGESDVTLDIDLQIKGLGATQFNNVPVITNRSYKGVVTMKEGESAVLMGSVSGTEQKSITGIPYLSRIPGLGNAFGTHGKQESSTELLVVVTPHVVRGPAAPIPAVSLGR
jgi:general secretion pathway protein D